MDRKNTVDAFLQETDVIRSERIVTVRYFQALSIVCLAGTREVVEHIFSPIIRLKVDHRACARFYVRAAPCNLIHDEGLMLGLVSGTLPPSVGL
mmetsp:Transcript_735/g.1623  ORF Transcript_735/g.1623 Transcript_735/m.1623 type:complete len:94 (-) Transcript_735:1110-1391(-)